MSLSHPNIQKATNLPDRPWFKRWVEGTSKQGRSSLARNCRSTHRISRFPDYGSSCEQIGVGELMSTSGSASPVWNRPCLLLQ